MQTGENEQGLRRIIDFIRLVSMLVLFIHFYITCYSAFLQWHLSASIIDRVIDNFVRLPVFANKLSAKGASLLLLVVSLIGAKGRKDEKVRLKNALSYIGIGLLLFFGSQFLLLLPVSLLIIASVYMGATALGYILVLSGGTYIARILKLRFQHDIFNKANESFPQEERLLENEYSVNLPARYHLKGKIRKSWINIINPFRGLTVLGTPRCREILFCDPPYNRSAHPQRIQHVHI
jgi:hypothetical protein